MIDRHMSHKIARAQCYIPYVTMMGVVCRLLFVVFVCNLCCGCVNKQKCLVTITEDSFCNAWVDTGGQVKITRGLMNFIENEDELAAVVAHEMGHLVAKHKGRQTPEKEMEADRIGLELMAKAGYNPNAAVRFWTRYYERIGWWEVDGTHQEPHERIETLKHHIEIQRSMQ